MRSPQRHRTAISARLRTPVGARELHAFKSAIASASDRTSGGRRRDPDEDEDERVDVAAARGLVALIARRARQRRAGARPQSEPPPQTTPRTSSATKAAISSPLSAAKCRRSSLILW